MLACATSNPVGGHPLGTYDIAKSLFLQALELPETARPDFVREQTEGLPELRDEVLGLLASHQALSRGFERDEVAALPQAIAGYLIRGELGRGGMGIVLRAARPGEPEVALKLIREGWLSPELLGRFRREAEALRRLDHPGISRFVAMGVEPVQGQARPWLAMELIEGESLRRWAAPGRSLAQSLEVMARVCDAVEHAHAHGIVHRDLKPENILIRPSGEPVVLDFGVARLAESDVRATTLMTSVGVLVGTIRYMSPEQADARPDHIGPRSDVHALAVIAYELITGRLPFEVPEDSVHRALVAVMTHPPLPMLELPKPVRAPLQRVLEAALAKDPESRTASAAELAADLRRVAAGRRPLAKPRNRRVLLARLPVGVWLALVSAGALAGILLSVSRRPPTIADYAIGALRPARQFERIRTEVDSAMVRIHVNTRTLPALREALTHIELAGALLRTVEREPWHEQVRSFQRYREGEARYLIAEREYDPAGFERAASVWLASSERSVPPRRVAMPDTIGSLARLYLEPALQGHAAAAMALEDRARLGDRARALERACRIRQEGAAIAVPSLRPLKLPEGVVDSIALAHWRAGVGGCQVAVAVQRWGRQAGAAADLASGLELLRLALADPRLEGDGSAHASMLHELGMGLLWSSALGVDEQLDSARRVLSEARSIRSQMPGYTSVVHSACALAEAERLAAWRAVAVADARAALARATAALDVSDRDDMRLAPADRALLELERASVLVDRACVERDSSLFSAATRILDDTARRIDDRKAPRLALQSLMVRYRIEAQRSALDPEPVHRVRLRSLVDQFNELLPKAGDHRLDDLITKAKQREAETPAAPFDLTYPQSAPF